MHLLNLHSRRLKPILRAHLMHFLLLSNTVSWLMRGAVALGNEFVEVRVVVEKPVLLGDRGIRPIIRVRGIRWLHS